MESSEMNTQPVNTELHEIAAISLGDILHKIKQRWILATSVAFTISALLAIVLLNQTPKYKASASLMIEFKVDDRTGFGDEQLATGSSLMQSTINTYIEDLKSYKLAKLVSDSLQEKNRQRLINYISDTGSKEGELKIPDLAAYISSMLNVVPVRMSQVIKIEIVHDNPHIAKLLADRYAKVFINNQVDLREQAATGAVSFLEAQAEKHKLLLEKEEEDLQNYRVDNDLVTVEQNQLIITNQLSDINRSITQIRVNLVGVKSYIDQINAAGESLSQIMNLPFIGGDTVVASLYRGLEELKKEQLVLSQTYLERHPRMVNNSTEQESIKESLWLSIRQTSQEFVSEKHRLEKELKSLGEEFSEAKEESRLLESLLAEYRIRNDKVKFVRNTFEQIVEQLNETKVNQQLNTSFIRILDSAKLPSKAHWPNSKITIALSLFVFVGFLVALPLGIELLDNRLSSFADIERYLGQPVLGDISNYKDCSPDELVQLSSSDDVLRRESFVSIYGSLRLKLGTFNKPLSLITTSSVPAEGKSIIASNLAGILSKQGYKTLVIDCDLRRPSQHRYRNFDNHFGLIEWLRSDAPITTDLLANPTLGIRPVDETNKNFLLSSGGTTKNPTSLLEDPRMDQLVSRIKQEFDVLIFDTPPIGVFHDASLVGDFADYTIFVARQYVTTRQKTRHSINTMNQSKAKVLGVIFNGVTNLRAAAGYNSYGSDYSERYQYGYGKYAKDYAKDYSEA